MRRSAPPLLNSDEMHKLETLVEEATRSTKEGVRYFIEPAEGTLRRAVSRRHHIVFGRRGSGKSSLLRKAGADLTVSRRPIAYVDLEKFKGHSYPDVLLSVLISTFDEFKEWLETAAIYPANKQTFWQKLFGSTPSRPIFNNRESKGLADRISSQIQELDRLLHAPDESERTSTAMNSVQRGGSVNANVSGAPGISAGASMHGSSSASAEVTDSYRNRKIEFLHRYLLSYQEIFKKIAALSGGDSYLFLDDLYHIRRSDQPQVLDYFHRIAKGNSLWLKVGTIRHRSDWYVHGDPPIGLKLGDDADQIDLDVTLEKYELAKGFLLRILTNFANEVGFKLGDFLTDGAKDRLVLASGGVARDFLSIFRGSIDHARERGGGARGEKIGAEDVNVAAGDYDTSKREEFKRDTTGDEDELDAQYRRISEFCLERKKANCFLLNKNASGRAVHLIRELVDLKLLHLVRSRVTVSKRQGEIYEAYMLDLSQYAGARKRRGLNIIEFWKPKATELLRQVAMIYEPS
jgi:hypothetical protein